MVREHSGTLPQMEGNVRQHPGEDHDRGSEVRTGEGETRCWDEVWTVILHTMIIKNGTKTLPGLI